jgi:DNA excision repair protein ERCC-2
MLEENDPLTSATLSLLGAFERLGRLCDNDTYYSPDGERTGYSISRQLPEKFSEELEVFAKKCDTWQKNNLDHAAYLYIEDLAYKIFEYKKIAERYGKGYLTFITREGESVSLLLYCLDPADELSHALDRAVASVMFSATLTPTDYFADILGGGKKTVSVSFPSPFPRENLCVAIMDKISTRYEDREGSYKKIASCPGRTISLESFFISSC